MLSLFKKKRITVTTYWIHNGVEKTKSRTLVSSAKSRVIVLWADGVQFKVRVDVL